MFGSIFCDSLFVYKDEKFYIYYREKIKNQLIDSLRHYL